jgi:hypothetical protein
MKKELKRLVLKYEREIKKLEKITEHYPESCINFQRNSQISIYESVIRDLIYDDDVILCIAKYKSTIESLEEFNNGYPRSEDCVFRKFQIQIYELILMDLENILLTDQNTHKN